MKYFIMIIMLPLIGIAQEAKKLEDLRARFVKGAEKRERAKNEKIDEATAEYKKSMVAWTKGYIAALEKEKVKETKAGRLKPALVYLAEIEKMKKLLEKPKPVVVKKPVVKLPDGVVRAVDGRRTPGFSGHHYKLIKGVVTWSEAQKRCKELGGQLACLESEVEAEFVFQMAKGTGHVWIGGHRVDGKWMWTNGKPVELPFHSARAKAGGTKLHLHVSNYAGKKMVSGYPDVAKAIPAFICEWPKQSESPTNHDTKEGPLVAVERTKWITLKPGAPVFGDTNKALWQEVPKELEGKRISQHTSRHAGVAHIEVLHDGLVVMVKAPGWGASGVSGGPWKKELIDEKGLLAAGWTRHATWFLVLNESKYPVWTRQCKKGEKFKIRTTKYFAPLIIDMR